MKSKINILGIRVGTPALTSRGLKEADFVKVAEFLDRAVKLAVQIQEKSGKNLKDFVAALDQSEELKVTIWYIYIFIPIAIEIGC